MKSSLANHVAFIMDGNGRWAKEQQQPRTYGHSAGVKTIFKIIDAALDHNEVKHLSFFAFSTENIKRPPSEVSFLLDLALTNLSKDKLISFWNNGVYFDIIGLQNSFLNKIFSYRGAMIAQLSSVKIEQLIKNLQSLQREQVKIFTSKDKRLTVNFLVNYSGQADIIYAVNKLLQQKIKAVGHDDFVRSLVTGHLPNIDLLVRTSGEMRISNFMLWHLAYSEILFIKKYWPSINENDFEQCLNNFHKRSRRFGEIKND